MNLNLYLKTSKEKIHPLLLGLVISFFPCAGSLYYRLSGIMQLSMSLMFIALIMFPVTSKNFIQVDVKQLIVICILMVFIVAGDPSLKTFGIPITLLMISMLFFQLIVIYQSENWMKYTIFFMKVFYFMYATYTILERVIPNLFLISVAIFPSSYVTLYEQYVSGCMPGLTNHYSTNGMLLGVGTIIYGCEMICKKKKMDILLFAYMLVALLLVGKRAHVIFMAVALYSAFFFYESNKGIKRIKNTLVIILVILILIFIIVNCIPALAVFINRFGEAAETGDITLGRTKMWQIALESFFNHPLLGIGWGQFQYINLHGWNAHNIYIQILAETGLIGLLIFIYFFLNSFIKAAKLLKELSNKEQLDNKSTVYILIAISIQTFFILYGLTGNPIYDREMYVPYYVACAVTNYCVNRIN